MCAGFDANPVRCGFGTSHDNPQQRRKQDRTALRQSVATARTTVRGGMASGGNIKSRRAVTGSAWVHGTP